MFARSSRLLVNGVALGTAAAIALVLGSACTKGPDCLSSSGCDGYSTDIFSVVARAANIVPPATDTAPRALASFNTASLAYTYNITTPPGGTIDSIALYQVAGGNPLPPSATAILCAGPAACAAASGTASVVGPATDATIKTSMRGYGTQLVFFTTTAQHAAGGAMRGTMYPSP